MPGPHPEPSEVSRSFGCNGKYIVFHLQLCKTLEGQKTRGCGVSLLDLCAPQEVSVSPTPERTPH